ncbi:TPA: hypothetical protein N0F65_010044 [Lagenidium giganteum]|uniref:uS12 prolyl 3,4-dihydroxylase n=1 Tax=Lagenidium giganteum TaxID=4803 RepID=A0AAV2ZBT3_9STRA|nr:TPA: hypothetical protein N0F65_010044 [Lagenidium giganteum]
MAAEKKNAAPPAASPDSTDDLQHTLKKARVAVHAVCDESIKANFAQGLFDDANVKQLAAAYEKSGPYLHTCIPALVDPTLLRAVRTEIEQHLVFTEKETDIYKVLQTGDLANIDGLPEEERSKLANLHRLRNALYSKTFRDFVSAVTDCGDLSCSKQDLSINSYTRGSHLLNHDDVIGTRRVSYILYLPDPQEWDPKFGGALELYPCVSKGTPDVAPTLVLPPKWNQFVMFTVQPGYSFHSVQEVIAPHDRLSISGWFHIPEEGEPGYVADASNPDAAPASLAQLEDDTKDVEYPFDEVSAETEDLTDADRQYLGEFMNAEYFKESNLEAINEKFGTDSTIQLVQFLKDEYAALLRPMFEAADERDGLAGGKAPLEHGAGVLPGWIVQGSPVKQRFMRVTEEPQENEPQEVTKLRELQNFFKSAQFRKWTYQVSGLASTHQRARARRFRPGLDYTLATYSNVSTVLDVTLCMTPPHECWAEGERGGYECYIATDEENDDPAVYRAAGNDSDTLLATQAGWNVLTMVMRDQGVMRFVKYVSALANGSRWDTTLEYLVANDEEEAAADDDNNAQ